MSRLPIGADLQEEVVDGDEGKVVQVTQTATRTKSDLERERVQLTRRVERVQQRLARLQERQTAVAQLLEEMGA